MNIKLLFSLLLMNNKCECYFFTNNQKKIDIKIVSYTNISRWYFNKSIKLKNFLIENLDTLYL